MRKSTFFVSTVLAALVFVSSSMNYSIAAPGKANADEASSTAVDFKRAPAEGHVLLNAGPFAFGKDAKYGLLGGLSFELWDLEKSFIQSFGANMIKSSVTAIQIYGAFYFEALPRLYVGPILGLDYQDQTGLAALSLRLLGPDPSSQGFFSILFTQVDLGIRSNSVPYGTLSFGLKLF